MMAMFAVKEVFAQVRAEHPDWQPQPCLLQAITNIVKEQEGGRRDQGRENDVMHLFIKHYGVIELERMMGTV